MKNTRNITSLAVALLFAATTAQAHAQGMAQGHAETGDAHGDHDNDHMSLNLGHEHDGICESQFEGVDDNRSIDFDFDSGDLIIEVEHDIALVITEEHDVIYHGRKLELSERGRQLAGDYYHTFDAVLGDITDIATDAATLGVKTASRAILAALTGGDTESIERDAEAQADKIEALAEGMCDRIGSIRGIEAEMAREIDGFQPVIFLPGDII